MASVTTNPEEKNKPVEPNADAPEPTPSADGSGSLPARKTPPKYPEPRKMTPAAAAGRPSGEGFFTIYKKGQGYWTRMGTAIAAVVVAGLTGKFIWDEQRTFVPEAWFNRMIATPALSWLGMTWGQASALALVIVVVAAIAYFAWRMMNQPRNVDFLIATDSEMKKVNWTSRGELIGSTKIVILFMVVIAVFLFVVDILFGYVFYKIGVLLNKPF